MLTEIRLPRLNVNDTSVRLVDWLASDGAKVSKGEPLCAVETTKASAEIEAERPGLLRQSASPGDELEVGAIVGWIADTAAELEGLAPVQAPPGEVVVTGRARRLAARLGVEISKVPSSGGFVREKDVEAFAGPASVDPFEPGSLRGRLEDDFLREIAGDPGFGRLSSGEKVSAYRSHGAEIGEGVSLGEGTVLLAEHLVLEEGASLGRECRVQAVSFRLGKMSLIGDRADILTRHVRIGDVLYAGAGVLIGGGGGYGPHARLVVGDSCLISRYCVLNTGGGIFIGDEVGLSPGVKLFTHNHWQSVLEGYHANFGPIVIENRAYITGDALVVPGVRIGEGATVLANSTVSADVPAYTMVSGNPAREVGRVERHLSVERKERIVMKLMEEMKAELAGKMPDGSVSYIREIDLGDPSLSGVVLTFKCTGEAAQLESRCVVFDLSRLEAVGEQGPLSDEVRNFLRRRGIRLRPIHWRYRADMGLYNA